MPKPSDYKAIALWGKETGSYDYYIKDEQDRAASDNAPLDATYKRDGTWRCVSDLAPEHPFRLAYEKLEKQ